MHICQKGQWIRSLNMLVDSIKKSGLYEETTVIRLGVVNDNGGLIPNELLNDPKMHVIYVGKSSEYERPTLLHMRKYSEIDPEDTKYYYLHTKGIRHFGNLAESYVIDWINLMLYWNIEQWKLAVKQLDSSDTYGCNCHRKGHDQSTTDTHYSGNFWWATVQHIRRLPSVIGTRYNDPEFWICSVEGNNFGVFHSKVNHYGVNFPREKYVTNHENELTPVHN